MKKVLTASIPALLIVGAFAVSVAAADTLAIFKGGIGVIPVSSGQGLEAIATVVNRNIVRGVQPAGQIWVISKLDALVQMNGGIRVDGEGLVLGGGNNVGGTAGQSVFATLICETTSPFTESSSNLAGVPLDANGNFRIDDVLSPAPPAPCTTPVLLIRSAANSSWFAAGIPRSDEDEDDDIDQ